LYLVFNGDLADYIFALYDSNGALVSATVAADGKVTATLTPGGVYYIQLTNDATKAVEYAGKVIVPQP